MPKNMQTDSFETNFYTDHPDKSADSEALLNAIIEGLLEKKAQDIQLLDVRGLTTLTDFFVVCHGTRSEEHTSELQSRGHLVCRLLLDKKKYLFSHFSLLFS